MYGIIPPRSILFFDMLYISFKNTDDPRNEIYNNPEKENGPSQLQDVIIRIIGYAQITANHRNQAMNGK